jgi:hypothetical protein
VAGTPQSTDDEPYIPEIVITETAEDEVLSVKVFPNPSDNGIFQVRIVPTYLKYTMTVSDSVGKILKLQSSAESDVVDLSSFAAGMYYLKLVSGKKIYTLKLIR